MMLRNIKSCHTAGFFFVLALLTGCSTDTKNDAGVDEETMGYHDLQGKAQGTTYQIKYPASYPNFHESIDSLLIEFDNSVSTYNSASLLTELNVNGEVVPDMSLLRLLNESLEMYRATGGAFNPAVYPLVTYWGFGNKIPAIIDSLEIDSLKQFTAFELLEIPEYGSKMLLPNGYQLEFNAIAQGLSVDLIAEFLESRGIKDFMVEIGGEVRCKGKNPKGSGWRIGIDFPEKDRAPGKVFSKVELNNMSLATSGNYRKFVEIDGKKYSHTINPFTGYPAHHNMLSVTVLHPICSFADAYATAFMVMGLEGTQRFIQAAADSKLRVLAIYDTGSGYAAWYSKGMEDLLAE